MILALPAPEKVGASNLGADTADDNQAIRDGIDAADQYVAAQRASFDNTLKIGRALEIISKRAMLETRSMKEAGPAFRAATGEALSKTGFDRIHKSERSRMRAIYRDRIAINAWRDELPDEKRDNLSSAKAVLSAFKAYQREQRGETVPRSSLAEQNKALKAKVEELQRRLDEMSEDGGSIITKDSGAGDIVDWMSRAFSVGKLQDIYGRLKKAIAAKKGEPPPPPKPPSPRFRKQKPN
jgi:hypothetical protein